MELQSQLELVIEELRLLEGVKMSLVGEIDMYRKLLEGETLRFANIVCYISQFSMCVSKKYDSK